MDPLDKITTEILRRKLDGVVAEMRATLINTACSPTISEMKECCCAVFTEEPHLVAIDNPRHLPSMEATAAAAVDCFQFNMGTADVILTNDPYGGGTRVQDLTLLAPVGYEDEIACYVGVRGHIEDCGGDLRGNFNPKAQDIWAEGIRCTPVKMVRDGKPAADLLNTVILNSRSPDVLRLDLEAMLAALNVGRRRLRDLIHQYGRKAVYESMNWSISYAERGLKTMLQQWPQGEFEGTSTLAHDCHGRKELAIKVKISNGERLKIDFSGTDVQSAGFVNATVSTCTGFALLPIFTALDETVPRNFGSLKCIDVVCPSGTLVNPTYPAPTGWSLQHCGSEIADSVVNALARMNPEVTANVTANLMLLFAVERGVRHGDTLEQLSRHDFSNFVQGGCSGTFQRDGWGMPGVSAEAPLPSVELFEGDTGIFVSKLEIATDSCGAGRWRGGPGTETVIHIPEGRGKNFFLTACVLTGNASGIGLRDGLPGPGNSVRLVSEEQSKNVEDVMSDWPIPAHSSIHIRMSGGPGWGSPTERDPASVLEDVLSEKVSPSIALEVYGVVIDQEDWSVDSENTSALRRRLSRS